MSMASIIPGFVSNDLKIINAKAPENKAATSTTNLRSLKFILTIILCSRPSYEEFLEFDAINLHHAIYGAHLTMLTPVEAENC